MKIKEFINEEDGIEKAIKKTYLMLQNDWTLTDIVSHYDETIEEQKVQDIKKKLKKNPVQYMTGKAPFLDDIYIVNHHVLIPRPETEQLVLETLKRIDKTKHSDILDIGTGSGIIALSLKKNLEKSAVTGVDISKKALRIAKKNQEGLHLDVTFIKSNLFSNVTGTFDVIISNPPYLEKKSKDIEKMVKKKEPKKALYAKEEGLAIYKRILKEAIPHLKEETLLAFEIGENQKEKITSLAKEILKEKHIEVETLKDFNGFDRYIFIKYKKHV